jgi:DNA helicase HerA-like ATPase
MDGTVYSIDGRTFSYEAPMTGAVAVGSYVQITTEEGRHLLAQIVGQSLERAPLDPSTTGRHTRVTSSGNLLAITEDGGFAPLDDLAAFGSGTMTLAQPELVSDYLDHSRGEAAGIEIGSIRGLPGAPARLNAAGFGRHTFLCGQSGSGKTYTLGVILERLLLETEIRVVVADPNSDFVRIRSLRPRDETGLSDEEYARLSARFASLVPKIHVAGGPDSELPLRAWLSDLSFEQQTAVLGLDPFADPEEYNAFVRTARRIDREDYGLDDVVNEISRAFDDSTRRLGLRIENLGVASLPIWASPDKPPTRDAITGDWRMLVVDLGGLPTYRGSTIAATALLGNLWRQRYSRIPTVLVIDEAHNVCPREPLGPNQALATEHVVRIAGEGRKYGLYLLLASQRPEKIHESVLSQCDNIVLMRMNSAADVRALSETFSYAPAGLVERCSGFRLGEGLAAGAIAADPLLFRTGRRYTEEGGSDVPSTWATGS